MPPSNDGPEWFDRFNDRIVADFVAYAQRTAEQKAREVERVVNDRVKRLFKQLSQQIVGAAAPPAWEEFTPAWKPLSRRYSARKRKLEKSGFYILTGALKKFLGSSDPTKWTGKPTVSIDDNSSGIEGYVIEQIRQAGGRVQLQSRGRNGRFGSVSDARNTRFGITVTPYSRIPAGSIGYSAVHQVFGAGKPDVAFKLANFRGREDRPALGPFLQWYAKYVILPDIQKVLNG